MQVSFRGRLNSEIIGVGKSCMLARITEEEFKNEYNVTIGVEFGNYLVEIDEKVVKL